jgi:hypothetical protein
VDISSSSSDILDAGDAAGYRRSINIFSPTVCFDYSTSEIQIFQVSQLVADSSSIEIDVGFPIVTYEVDDGFAMLYV